MTNVGYNIILERNMQNAKYLYLRNGLFIEKCPI